MAQGPRYEVTITNLTQGQVFTPILVAAHQPGVSIFHPGEAASTELEMLAEGGVIGPLAAQLSTMDEVADVADSGGVLPPGQTTTVEVQARGGFQQISLAAMLVPTNDGFVALNGVTAPTGPRWAWPAPSPPTEQTITVYAPAWDAGTEANDESCASVPGPPQVCQGEGFNASRQGAEGFVHIHRGINGAADLSSAERDWKNPVARVVIRRLP